MSATTLSSGGTAPGNAIARLLAPGDVGRRLGLSSSRVVQLDREGVLPALRDASGRRFYEADAVEEFAAQRASAREAAR